MCRLGCFQRRLGKRTHARQRNRHGHRSGRRGLAYIGGRARERGIARLRVVVREIEIGPRKRFAVGFHRALDAEHGLLFTRSGRRWGERRGCRERRRLTNRCGLANRRRRARRRRLRRARFGTDGGFLVRGLPRTFRVRLLVAAVFVAQHHPASSPLAHAHGTLFFVRVGRVGIIILLRLHLLQNLGNACRFRRRRRRRRRRWCAKRLPSWFSGLGRWNPEVNRGGVIGLRQS
mmetsp:Transcript_9711/g.36031  ORF Transcript_9711/g.36031 Transcript_9711/m.36031 type:complete len:233 (+) Transcript_9711:1543-2241(+)